MGRAYANGLRVTNWSDVTDSMRLAATVKYYANDALQVFATFLFYFIAAFMEIFIHHQTKW